MISRIPARCSETKPATNITPLRLKTNSFVIKYGNQKFATQQKAFCKSTMTNSIGNAINRTSERKVIKDFNFKKLNSNKKSNTPVIKLGISTYIKKLLLTDCINSTKLNIFEHNKINLNHQISKKITKNFSMSKIRLKNNKNHAIPKQIIKDKLFHNSSHKECIGNKCSSKKSRNPNPMKYVTWIGKYNYKDIITKLIKQKKGKENNSESSYSSNGCRTVIEHECDNDYSWIYDNLNEIHT